MSNWENFHCQTLHPPSSPHRRRHHSSCVLHLPNNSADLKVSFVSVRKRWPSFNRGSRHSFKQLRLVHKRKMLACTCHLAARLLQVQRSTLSSVYQAASECLAPASDAPAESLHPPAPHSFASDDTHSDLARAHEEICTNVIFVAAAVILWDYTCQVNFEQEFQISAGSHCQYEAEIFVLPAIWMCFHNVSPTSSIYQDVTKQVELWLNRFFFAWIYLQRAPYRTDALFWFMLNLAL